MVIFSESIPNVLNAEEGKKQKTTVFSRIVGYLRPVEQWNEGKREEFKQRKIFDRNGTAVLDNRETCVRDTEIAFITQEA